MNILVFDIETIPDVVAGRKLYSLDNMTDAEVAKHMFEKRAEETGSSDFLKHYLHKVAAISVVMRQADRFKVWSLGELSSSEKDILQRFFDGIDRYTPTLVSWNGANFDLPVLHYRSLLHSVQAPRYWENGQSDPAFKWNNYLSRFHERHTDLMDVLSGYQNRATAKLDDIATLLGFPGKMGMDGSKVWDAYQNGELHNIRNYCETDVLNTYLVYLRFLLIQGKLTQEQYEKEFELVMTTLNNSEQSHLINFAKACQPQ